MDYYISAEVLEAPNRTTTISPENDPYTEQACTLAVRDAVGVCRHAVPDTVPRQIEL